MKEGVLALLEAGPQHGYGLKLAFEQATGETWELNVGQVYGVLQRLEFEGCIAFDGEDEGRKRYRLTEAGRERLTVWLTQDTVGHTLSARDELSMKILLAGRTAVASPRAVIAVQRDATMVVLQDHTATKAALGAEAPFERLVLLDRLIVHCRAELDWLDLLEQRLDDRARRHADHVDEGAL